MTKLNNKIYNVKNGSDVADVYLGRSTIQGFRHSDQTYYYQHFNKNVKDTFLFASVVGSQNIKLVPPTEETPFLQIDSRYYNFYNSTQSPASFFSSISKGNETISVYFRSINTDGSLFIKQSKNDKFLWNGFKLIEDTSFVAGTTSTTCTDGTIRILTPDYKLADNPVSSTVSFKSYSMINDRVIDKSSSTVSLMMKKIVGSKCIKVINKSDRIRIEFDKLNCPCGNIINTSSSSSSSSSNSSSSSSSNSSSSSSSSSSKSSLSSLSSQSHPSSQSSLSSISETESSVSQWINPLLCNGRIPIKKDAYVQNSRDMCIPNGRYVNTFVSLDTAIWEFFDNPLYRIIVTKTDMGEWVVRAESPEIVYSSTLAASSLSCIRGWVEGIAPIHLFSIGSSSSSSESQTTEQSWMKYTSVSSLSSLSSSSSYLNWLYREFFGVKCINPYCSSEYYCIYDIYDEWVCGSYEPTFFYPSSSSSSSSSSGSESSSSSSSDSSSSESSSSSSSSSPGNCPETIVIVFGLI